MSSQPEAPERVTPSYGRHPTEARGALPAGLEDQGSCGPSRACPPEPQFPLLENGLITKVTAEKMPLKRLTQGTVAQGWGAERPDRTQGLPGVWLRREAGRSGEQAHQLQPHVPSLRRLQKMFSD